MDTTQTNSFTIDNQVPLDIPLPRVEDVQKRLLTLSDREQHLQKLVVAGVPNKRIAGILGISQRTVDRVRAKVFEKMRVDSAVELAQLVIKSQRPYFTEHEPENNSENNRESSIKFLDIWQRNRKSLAQEINANIAQNLAESISQLEQYDRLREVNAENADTSFDKALSLLKQSIEEVRQLVRDLQKDTGFQDQ